MIIFDIENGEIAGSKSIDIGRERQVTFALFFDDITFSDNDVFELILNDDFGSQNYSFTNDGKLKFVNVDFGFIQQETTSVSLTVTKNGNQIVSDTITVTAEMTGSGETDNQLKIHETENSIDIIAINFNAENDIEKVILTSNNASLTINQCTNYTAVSGKIPTFELWIKTNTAKTSITVSNSIEIVGDYFPDELSTGKIHCFVWRFVGNKQTINYSYDFTEN